MNINFLFYSLLLLAACTPIESTEKVQALPTITTTTKARAELDSPKIAIEYAWLQQAALLDKDFFYAETLEAFLEQYKFSVYYPIAPMQQLLVIGSDLNAWDNAYTSILLQQDTTTTGQWVPTTVAMTSTA